jgi:hypothetical protein
MTAADQPELIAAAAAAVEAGMEQAQLYQEAAAARPGQGAEVRLPSTPGVVGLSYDTPGDPAPMPGRPQIKLVPDYASDVVGGASHPAGGPAASAQWPANTNVTVVPGALSSLVYAPASTPVDSWPKRIAAALKKIFKV